MSDDQVTSTGEHIARSPNASIAKPQQLINYALYYGSQQTIFESVTWLIEQGKIVV